MQLRRTLLTPAERELLAYDVPQTGALVFILFPIFAILLSTMYLTTSVTY
jgi:hypothetical protein